MKESGLYGKHRSEVKERTKKRQKSDNLGNTCFYTNKISLLKGCWQQYYPAQNVVSFKNV